jgi:hypothetical protein
MATQFMFLIEKFGQIFWYADLTRRRIEAEQTE